MLGIYRLAIEKGQFNRHFIANRLKMVVCRVEGRWYGEINRARKNGNNFDWKTIMNSIVMR